MLDTTSEAHSRRVTNAKRDETFDRRPRIALLTEATGTSKKSLDFFKTSLGNIPAASHLHWERFITFY
jgi:hypothetical protein